MKVNNWFLLAALGGGAYYLLKGYADKIIGNIDYKFDTIKWSGYDSGFNFSVILTLRNKNNETLTINSLAGNLTWRNTLLANFTTNYKTKPLVLSSNIEKKLIIFFNVPILKVLSEFTIILLKLKMGTATEIDKAGFYVKGDLDGALNNIRGKIPFSQHLTLADYGL